MLRPLRRLQRAVWARRGGSPPTATRTVPLGRHARVVQDDTGRRLVARRIGRRSWLVQPRTGPARYAVTRIGPRRRSTVLLSPSGRRGHDRLPLLRHLADEHVADVLSRLGVTCVLDVGANKGQYARRLRATGYTGRIISFEPVAHLAEELEQAAADDPDWQLVRCALGREDTESEIKVASGHGTMSSMLSASDFGRSWNKRLREEEHVQAVHVRRLDGLWDELLAGMDDPRVYLKLDTQGFDLEAFAGAGERTRDVLAMQSEVSSLPIYEGMPAMTEQLETYRAAGFDLTGMFPVTVNRPTMGVIEFDAVLVRPEAVASAGTTARPAQRTAIP